MKKFIIGLILFITVLSVGCTEMQPVSSSDTISEEQPALEPEVGKKDDIVTVKPEEEKPVIEEPIVEEETKKEENGKEAEEKTEEETVLEDIDLKLPQIVEKETSSLSNETNGWSWKRNTEHESPIAYADTEILESYNAYYLGDTDEKVIYLTFDNGYENGYTETILDALAANDVKVTFFVTLPYIRDNKELVIRMKEEGHIVGNHSVTHQSMPSLSDDEVIRELEDTATYMLEKTGYEMDPYFRPPMGEYSERTLYLTNSIGYKTIFWSMAYVDWKVDDQPGADYALDHVITNYHPGSIPLLHSVSSSNAEAMDNIIESLLAKGYRFGTLNELQ